MILATKAAVAHSGAAGLPYQWVVGGSNGRLRTSTSTTANSWTSQTSSFGSTDIYGIASNALNLYVAVGGSGKLATSPDGITWTQRTSSFSSSRISGISWSGTYWVACGDDGKIATSTDGITWTQRTSGETSALYSSAYGNGVYVVAGFDKMRTATDPTSTWTSRTSTLAYVMSSNDAVYYAPDQAIWVAGTDGTFSGTSTGTLASSTDGTSWTGRNSPFTIKYFARGAFTSTASVIVGGIEVDSGVLDICSSTNGTTWSNRTPADTSENSYFAAVDDLGTMIVGASKIQSSTNGSSWTDQGEIDGGVLYYCGCHSAGKPAIR